MACQSCAERRERMKAWLQHKLDRAAHWAKVREGHADTSASPPAEQGDGTQAPAAAAEGSGQAGPASDAHGHEGVATDPGMGAGEGHIPVPRVRKARDGQAGAR